MGWLLVARDGRGGWDVPRRSELMRIGRWLHTHQDVYAIQLLLQSKAERREGRSRLLQKCLGLSDLPFGGGAGLIAIAYKLNKTLVCRDLAFRDDDPGLIAPDLEIRIGRLGGDGHPRARLIRLSGLRFVT